MSLHTEVTTILGGDTTSETQYCCNHHDPEGRTVAAHCSRQHVCFMSPALLPPLFSSPCLFFTLPTAITYPEREGSDKLSSAVIGQLADDMADRHGGDRREEKLIHIKQKVRWHVAVPAPCTAPSSMRFKGQI